MGELKDIQRVADLLSLWKAQIHTRNDVDFFDINRVAENISAKLLNLVYNWNLKNLNEEQRNFPGIDLGDDDNKIAFQITSKKDPQKIKESLEKFVKGPIQRFPNGIRFLIINDRKPDLTPGKYQAICPTFDPNEHIYTNKNLMVEIREIFHKDRERFDEILAFLEKEFRDDRDSGGRKTGDVFAILKEGSKRYYDALRGPNGRFKYHRKISDIILPRPVNDEAGINKNLDSLPDGEKIEIMENLSDALPLLWKKECKHTVIVGEPGTGKTFSLIHLWGKFLENSAETKPVTLFIALNEYNQLKEEKRDEFILSMIQENYGNASTTQKEIWEAMKRSSEQCESIPLMVLLLDGFNEITVEKGKLLQELDHIVEQCPGIQLIITCRSDMRDNFKRSEWNLLELMELEDVQVDKFLEIKGLELPRYEQFRALCKNPMNLTLYTGTFEPTELKEYLDSLFKAKTFREIAELYRIEKKFDKAYSFAMEAISLDDRQESEIIYKLGVYAALAGDTSNALIWIRRSIALDPAYSHWAKNECKWEEIKTDILNHLGCFVVEETSKEPLDIDEIEVLSGGKEEVKEIRDKNFLTNLRKKLQICNEGMKNPSFYISFDCIRSWFKLKDIRPKFNTLISTYKNKAENSKKYSELMQSPQTFMLYKRIFFILSCILTGASWLRTSYLYYQIVAPPRSNLFFDAVGVVFCCFIIIVIFPIDLIFGLLGVYLGQNKDLFFERSIMAFITIVLSLVAFSTYSIYKYYSNEKNSLKQKIKDIEIGLKDIEKKIESLKADIINQLNDIRWE